MNLAAPIWGSRKKLFEQNRKISYKNVKKHKKPKKKSKKTEKVLRFFMFF